MRRRRFTFDEQMAFAELSGDYNPLHIDPIAARRCIFGRPVVHGVHALLKAFDDCLEGYPKPLALGAVKVVFRTPIGVDETVSYALQCEDKNRLEIALLTAGANAAWIQVAWAPAQRYSSESLSTAYAQRHTCRILSTDEAATASGSLDLYLNLDRAAQLFPHVLRVLPLIQVAELLATSRLVGMECPGFHSIYSGLDLTFSPDADGPRVLSYEVTACDRWLSLLKMKVTAPGMRGTIKAFLRPTPQQQASFVAVRGQVNAGEFAGQHSLVIGGSRGLGEATAKLLAAGGAEVKITYYQGAEDAHRVRDEITTAGGAADCLPFDVLQPPQDLGARLGEQWVPTHLYYFATPFIAVATGGSFSPQLFQNFCAYYVTGFLNTVRAIRNLGAELRKIFYPSSVFLDELPLHLGEYAAAKMAGEVLCAFLEKSQPGLKIHKPRLPRMATDQTTSLLPVNKQDAVPLLLEQLRYLRDA